MSHSGSGSRRELLVLSLGALGIVYGDIGTSPLYAVREAFHGPFAIAATPGNVLGVMSLVIWVMTLIIVVKYLTLLLRADHQGQGGILALLTMLTGDVRSVGRHRAVFIVLGLFGAALLYGDGIITPAISVLSAVEGLAVAAPSLESLVVPVTVAILLVLFAAQRRGTGPIGVVFGPLILVWMVVIALLGIRGIATEPGVLAAFNPVHAVRFFLANGKEGFLILSAVVLVVTGGEALYADLGHFGRRPIRLSWFTVAFPALILNYLGQGAFLLRNPDATFNPFYELAPQWARFPLVLLATAATVVASQALISACFSLTQQLVNLGYMPRVEIIHTSARFEGQIYVPTINTFLMLSCITLVLFFRSSSSLAAAYGLSVTGTMAVTTVLFYFVARSRWNWSALHAGAWAGCFLAIELALLGANLVKILHGGWVPLAVGAALYLLMSTWRKGRLLVIESFRDAVLDMEPFLAEVAARNPPRVPGTAVFMTREQKGVPPVLLHHLKHNEVLHQNVILLSVVAERVPEVSLESQIEVIDLGTGVYRMILRHGFMSAPNITQALSAIKLGDQPINLARTSFYFGRETILPTGRGRMARWRKKLFAIMSRNATPATAFFGVPPNRVVELGTQVAL